VQLPSLSRVAGFRKFEGQLLLCVGFPHGRWHQLGAFDMVSLLLQDSGTAQLRSEIDGLRTSLQEADDRLAAANRVISSYKVIMDGAATSGLSHLT
jgi:hypothetical protein